MRNENGFYREELKHVTVQSYSRYMHSFNEFIQMKIIKNNDKYIYDLNYNGRGFIVYQICFNCTDELL